ncbi:MAG: triose-phosphate isomerase [Gammaproteobacteria bacterium]|nr:triose-phosphate isomerase [Gammaproteobacteria bacterium]
MRKFLIAGNWKMNGTRDSAVQLADEIVRGLEPSEQLEILVCPPFIFLLEVARRLKNSRLLLGAQDICADDNGAYTGEVSGSMLREAECRYVIVGHSERRSLYAENDSLVARKFIAAQNAGLIPILCVGETLEQRQNGQTHAVVLGQLNAVLEVAGLQAFGHAVMAYEPVWAIGTGKNATPEQAQEVHASIRASLGSRDAKIASRIRLLYGGSVKAANAAELLKMPDIDGGLVGGASLEAKEFLAICKAAG